MTTSLPTDMRDHVHAWIADDPDPSTRDALTELLERADQGDAAAEREIIDAFAGTLQFGTAGLRGAMGPGPNRMNLAVVSRAARGLADYLIAEVASEEQATTAAASTTGDTENVPAGTLSDPDSTAPDSTAPDSSAPNSTAPNSSAGVDSPAESASSEPPLVIVGYDARYRSRDFALATAQIMTAAGCRVKLLDRHGPTPLVAFAVRRLHADAGVVVTASHNPPADNGYKVYLGGRCADPNGQGVQIVPPADRHIAQRIAAVGSVERIPRADSGWEELGDQLREHYLERICALPDSDSPRDVRIVHTAMHGVGTEMAFAALHRCGFMDVHAVAKQADPDPDFPTVPFPNPEEKGAIDLALELARTVEADVVIANDPDADRCAAAVFDPHQDQWRMLSGDELGVLLADHLLRSHDFSGVFARSIVSSRWVDQVVSAAGQQSATTLTGFKWIARAPGVVFGYEEAIGYCVLPEVVRDKDGLSAALMVAEMAAQAKADGSSLVHRLDEIAREHGLYATSQVAVRVDDLDAIGSMMSHLRSNPPAQLAGSDVVQVQDLADGSVETTGLPPTEGLLLLTADDTRVIARPSGTEPKLKCYLEVVEPVNAGVGASDADLAETRRRAQERMEHLTSDVRAALGQ